MGKIININNLAIEEKYTTKNSSFAEREEVGVVYSKSGSLKEKDNSYWRLTPKGEKKISNFIINPLELVQMDGYAEIKVQFITDEDKVYQEILKTSDFSSSSRFKIITCGKYIDLLFKGKDDDLDEIKDLINQRHYELKQGIGYTGIVKNKDQFVFVSANGLLDSNSEEANDIVFVGDNNVCIDTYIISKEPIWEPELEQVSKVLFNFNELPITSTIIGFSASCFLKEKLYQLNGTKFNHLMVVGEAGTGKSETIENIVMPLFSTESFTNADQCTKFVATKLPSSSNTIPLIIDEYKPTRISSTQMNIISEVMRNAYNRTPAYRGRSDQGVNKYPILSPIILVGEMLLDETAVLERSLVLYLSKSVTKDTDKKKAYEMLKANKDTINSLGRSLLEEALKVDAEKLLERQQELFLRLPDHLPSRVRNSAVNCMLGILLLEDVYKSMCFDFGSCTGYSVEELFKAIIRAVETNILDGQQSVNGIVENCLEVFNDMAEQGEILRGHDYEIINSGQELALDIKSIYGTFIRYAKSHNMRDLDLLTEKQFIKQLTFKEYFVEGSEGGRKTRTVVFKDGYENKRKKAIILNIEKLSSIIDISNLCN